jgi:hypothetical protein
VSTPARTSDQDAAGIDEQIKAYESTFLVDAEKRGLAAYHPRWDAYRKAYTEVLEAAARGDIEAFASTAEQLDDLVNRFKVTA